MTSKEEAREIAHTLWYRGSRLRNELHEALVLHPENWHAECLQQMLAQWDEIADQYASKILLAKPSAEGDGWIAVTERLPDAGEPVLVYSKYWSANPFVGRLHRGEWEGEPILSRPDSVTHWRPLPAPPSGQGEVK